MGCHHHSRRGLLGAGLGALGVGLLPLEAQGATVTALAITCIDYRLVDDTVAFFDGMKLKDDYDQVSLAGAALAAVSAKFPSSNAAFWDHIAIAKQLHSIKRVIVVDHRDCGAFKVAFGKAYKSDRAGETAQHKTVMQEVKAKMARLHPDLRSEFYLMGIDGKAERII
jgi:carbonic anhydrase